MDAWELIQDIEQLIKDNNVIYERSPVIINKGSGITALNRQQKVDYKDKHVPIDKWIFNKLIMEYSFISEGALTPGIAIALNLRGFEVRYGYNVSLCKNMCIFGNNRILSTYSGPSTHEYQSVKGILYDLSEWIKNYEQKLSVDRKIIRMMLETEFNLKDKYSELVGNLYRIARKFKTSTKEIPPLHYENLGKINDKMEAKSILWPEITTLWGVYNLFSTVLKPEKLSMEIGRAHV